MHKIYNKIYSLYIVSILEHNKQNDQFYQLGGRSDYILECKLIWKKSQPMMTELL